ncbi:hybrid sensor histidine kinase/response regulator transcription factor [Psychroserpens ponticola]|uniref:histidine kinase n=1 Tax=Psychroserpens ponticola TaxID=2932268 RepID=A0ABY7S2W2_9FLAO|nr:hybrid sensor histidine kinase/response regulator transcription factor [Psychroserpens ponticola]WCO02806.1 two-component regulator propeller domain-containing protein [Psychroserpens ponticola]
MIIYNIKHILIKTWYVAFYVLSTSITFSQTQKTFQQLSIKDGLSQSSAISIAQDSTGYLWIATQEGLNKYDGKTFMHYKKQFEDITKANYSKLGKVYVDRENVIWIITNSGNLEKFNRKNETFKKIESIKDVSAIFQDTKLNTYIGTYNNGLYKIDKTTKDTLQVFKKEDFQKSISSIIQQKDAVIITALNGVINLDINTNSYSNNSQTKAYYSCIDILKDGSQVIGTYGNGLFIQSNGEYIPFNTLGKSSLPNNLNIQSVLVDKNNKLWIATYGQGVYVLDFEQKTINHIKVNKNDVYAIHYDYVLSLFEDYSGIVWIGTDGAGLSYYDEHLSKFNILTNNQLPIDVSVNQIRSITKNNKSDDLWLGTFGEGLTKINFITNQHKTYTTQNSKIRSNRVVSLAIIDDELWIGHQDFGLELFNKNGEFRALNNKSKIKFDAQTVWNIFRDSKNRIWLCTREHGLFLYDKNKGVIDNYRFEKGNLNSIPSNNIRTITEAKNGLLWIGTDDNGICSLNPETKKITPHKKINDKIKSLLVDNKRSILWIGTFGNGLKSYNTKTREIKTYNTENGISNNVIYGILPDNNNNLWLSSNKGICKFNSENLDFPNIINYNIHDGLQSLEFNTGAYFKDKNGLLFFGGLEGLNWFNPNLLTTNPVKPKTVITKLELFNKKHKILENEKFKHNLNTFTFNFAGLHYSLPNRNSYQYQLVNYDENWIQSGNNTIAHYSKLNPGDYTFKVKSSNYDAVWNDIPATYSFTILQPWYLSYIALVFYFSGFFLTIYGVYKYLKWKWHMNIQLQLEQEETERLKQLDEFKTKLYTNISHEFRTPLTLISGPIDKQLENPKLSKNDKKELSLVQRNSKRLLNLVNQLLDLSKLETGNLNLTVSNGNLAVLLKQLVAAFEFKAKEKNIEFNYNIRPIDKAWFDKDVIEKIVINLLSNAIKYTKKNGRIHFNSTIKNGQIIISIINNGNILTQEELSKLFQRYYQNNKSADGVGIGLSLVKELVILSHGNILANTINDDEIQFTVTLPIERSFFNSSEINEDQLFETKEITNQEKDYSTTNKTTFNNNKPLLHIVEDDDDIRQYIASIFEEDYTIKDSINGEQGIANAIKEIPDIIISDIMMPKVDGIELCNTLKLDERTSHIPIILLTAKSGDQNEIIGLKTGADDYFVKPFNSNKLKIKVEKLIELRKQLQQRYSNSLELKDITTTSVDQQFLSRLKSVLNENMTNTDFSSEVLSKKMLMSRMQLHRKLNALTGLTTTQLIRNERLKIAITLLKQSELTISEIAYQIGFNTPSYFIKNFKDVYKCTPLEYALKYT